MGVLSQILQSRSRVLFIQGPQQNVSAVVAMMAEQQIGAIPICEDGRLVGIFSERDFVRRVAAAGLDPDKTPLGAVMTPDPVTASPNEPNARCNNPASSSASSRMWPKTRRPNT